MRKYAILTNNIVTRILECTEAEVLALNSEIIVDIEDSNPQPQLTWVLEGNKLVPNGEPIPPKIKIFNYVSNTLIKDKSQPPFRTDFITGLDIKLHRKSILVKGECIREEYYENATVDPTTGSISYSNLIIKEETTYTRNSLGFPVMKNSVISYAMEDGSFHSATKTITKVYSALEQIAEGKTRRGNLVDNLQMPCIGLISIAMIGTPNATTAIILEGRRFLAAYKTEFEVFVSASDKTILSCLNDSQHPKYISSSDYSWIDSMTPYGVTIRQYLINELTI